MTDNNTSEEEFKHADSLVFGELSCGIESGTENTLIEIYCAGSFINPGVDEARALRDWLNKVLP